MYWQKSLSRKIIFTITLISLLSGCDSSPKAEKTIDLAPGGVFAADFSENYALLGTVKGNAELWQLNKKQLLHTWQHSEENLGIIHVAIANNEEYALTAERNSIAWWRITDGSLIGVWSLPDIHALSLSADGQFALVGLADKAIYFALQYGKTLYAFNHEGPVTTTALANQYAITGSVDQTAKLWNLSTGALQHNWQHHNRISTVALSGNGKFAFTNASLSQSNIWKTNNGKLYKKIGPNLMTISAAAFTENGQYLVTGRTSQRLDLWHVKSGKNIEHWRPEKGGKWRPTAATILSLTFANKNKKILSFAANGYFQRWRR
jgi:WD40 repeat protein